MNINEFLDAILSFYVYKKFFGFRKYFIFYLKNLRTTNKKNLFKQIERLTLELQYKITIFTTGTFIKENSSFVKDLYALGHEIGYHSYSHVSSLSRNKIDFNDDLVKGKELFNKMDITCNGYRSPHLLFDDSHYSILKDNGFKYSSSKYTDARIYQPFDDFYEIPVNFFDIFDFKGKMNDISLKERIKNSSVQLYHPYWLFSERYREYLFKTLSSVDIKSVTLSDYLNNKKGICITLDLNL